MLNMKKPMIKTLAVAAGTALGGYYLGCKFDTTNPPSSAFMAKAVLLPATAGIIGWYALKNKNAALAKGLLYGGIAGSVYGYLKPCAATIQATGTAAYLGSPQGVRRALNSASGSGIGRSLGASILPRRLQGGGSAYPADAWARS